mmetsp:Transcript_26772/g.103998  ORF Transcript_26772/g.103998 Transcript_26772/m.103998 type:complete len:111 (-) Transcript_26772:575-907(-)
MDLLRVGKEQVQPNEGLGLASSSRKAHSFPPGNTPLRNVIHCSGFIGKAKIKIKRMEIELKRKESAGPAGTNVHNETDTIGKFEVMDGAPVRSEKIPIRLFLSAYDSLTP